jgi:hypothetical protein
MSYKVEGVYYTSEVTCNEEFETEKEAKEYYEKLIIELEEDFEEDVKNVIDYITIYEENDDVYVRNIETYTYD